MSGKPPYRIPSMAEIRALPWNGFTVASTFSGGGGSCLGYRMAGFRVAYANEFIEEAQKTYRANHEAFLDTRDIRKVTPESVLEILKMERGQLDLFDGSPPCCAFSTAGRREEGWSTQRDYSDGAKQRIDDLFFEYARLVRGIQPKTFVAENVSGLVKGTAKGYFKLILQELKDCGYEVKAALLDASRLGVPQKRQRIIFVGVRKDLAERFGVYPCFPKPLPYVYTLGDALTDLKQDEAERQEKFECAARYRIGQILRKMPKDPRKPTSASELMGGSYFNLIRESLYEPCTTVCQGGGWKSAAGPAHPLEDRKFTVPELKRIFSIPDDFVLTGTYVQQWERLGRMVPPLMMKAVAETVSDQILRRVQ